MQRGTQRPMLLRRYNPARSVSVWHSKSLRTLVPAMAVAAALSAVSAPAANAAPLIAEQFSGTVTFDTTNCAPSTSSAPSTFTFTASGTATGAYQGPFTETGTVTASANEALLAFSASFTIMDPANGKVTGTKTFSAPSPNQSLALCYSDIPSDTYIDASRPPTGITYTAQTPDCTDQGTAAVQAAVPQTPGAVSFTETFSPTGCVAGTTSTTTSTASSSSSSSTTTATSSTDVSSATTTSTSTATSATSSTATSTTTTPSSGCLPVAQFSFIYATGCFHVDSGQFVSTPGTVVHMNGLTITPAPNAWVIVDTGNRAVTSEGIGGVSISAGNVNIHRGDLSLKVPDETGQTQVSVGDLTPPSGAMVAGLALTGNMAVQITNTRGTSLDGRVTLPFGYHSLGSVAVHLDTTLQDGLKSDSITAEEKNLVLGPLEVKDLSLSYSPIDDIWQGSVDVVLPTPNNYDVAAMLAFQHGRFKSASGSIDNLNFEVVGGIFLQRISLSVAVDPLQLGGGLGVTAGPQVGGKAAVRVDGNFFYRFAQNGNPGQLHLMGQLQLAGFPVASAYFDYLTTGSVDFGGFLFLGLPDPSAQPASSQPVYISAFLTGWIDGPHAFDIEVGASVKIAGLFTVSADLLASNVGMAACGQVWFLRGGFGYYWATHELDIMGSSCDVGPWRVIRPGGAGGAQAGARTLTLPAGGALLRLTGASASPQVTLHGPAGQVVSVPLDPHKPIQNNRFVVFQIPSMKTTYIAIHHSAGRWTIASAPGSSPISDLKVAGLLPAPQVRARVIGHGRRRTLTWSLRPEPGQRVLFAEVGPQTHRMLALVSAGHGSLQFTPGDGKGGPRTIIAQVENRGLPRAQFTVARYTAPPPLRPGRPGRLRGSRLSGGRMRLTWTSAPNADSYVIRIRLGDGAEIVQFAGRHSRSVVITDVVPINAATVSVTGQRTSGTLGPAVTARFVFTPKPAAKRQPSHKRTHAKASPRRP